MCDTFDHEDYPVYVYHRSDYALKYHDHNGVNMQTVMEVYDLGADMNAQLDERRSFHPPV